MPRRCLPRFSFLVPATSFTVFRGQFPPPLWYNLPRAPMPDGKRCKMSLGLEPSLRAGSLYVCGIMTVGRNASAFLGNAADKRRVRTAWSSVHGIIRPGQKISKDFHFIRSAPHPFRNPPSYSRRRRKTSHDIPCTIPYENKLAKQVPPYHSKTEPNRAGPRTLPCPCRGTIEKADGHRRNSSVAVLSPGRKSW